MVEIATQSKIRRGGTRRHEGDTKKRERRRNGKPEGKQGYASLTRRYRMYRMIKKVADILTLFTRKYVSGE